ncbi:MAG: rhodanese-like domain-containing protein [Granulosicoccus sp.]|nr:rhodanese-like domain-containing protein [Granulosicoccus sp.]
MSVPAGQALAATETIDQASTETSSRVVANELTVKITADMATVTVETSEGPVEITREQDTTHQISGEFSRTSRPCPPFCVQPMKVAEGVSTVGELEILDMLRHPDGLVIDSREFEWYLNGTIPGSVHIPYTEIAGRLDELGCTRSASDWICDSARQVALFCNGPWCGQSPTAIRAMIREGYPAGRIAYYRGGMQMWQLLGLTVIPGEF